MSGCSLKIHSEEAAWASAEKFEGGNLGHRPTVRAAISRSAGRQPATTSAPRWSGARSLRRAGRSASPRSGHRRPVRDRHKFSHPGARADWTQILKYVVHNVAHSYGKTATFMPKPIVGDNGSGMHVPVDLEGRQEPVRGQRLRRPVEFRSVLHRRHHQARPRPERHHQPGDQLLQAPGARLRSPGQAGLLGQATARPRSASRSCSRTRPPHRVRFPDPIANPYLCFAALMMAGLDGVQNKIHPGDPADKNLYDLPPEEDAKIPTVAVPASTRPWLPRQGSRLPDQAAASSPTTDRCLHRLKMEEVTKFRMTTHPVEFDMYYSCSIDRVMTRAMGKDGLPRPFFFQGTCTAGDALKLKATRSIDWRRPRRRCRLACLRWLVGIQHGGDIQMHPMPPGRCCRRQPARAAKNASRPDLTVFPAAAAEGQETGAGGFPRSRKIRRRRATMTAARSSTGTRPSEESWTGSKGTATRKSDPLPGRGREAGSVAARRNAGETSRPDQIALHERNVEAIRRNWQNLRWAPIAVHMPGFDGCFLQPIQSRRMTQREQALHCFPRAGHFAGRPPPSMLVDGESGICYMNPAAENLCSPPASNPARKTFAGGARRSPACRPRSTSDWQTTGAYTGQNVELKKADGTSLHAIAR